ncbi:hypothetical protein Hanom_Chr05g00446251 [Helianthus anomalus]
MFPNNQNPWDPSNSFWQSLQNNEQEDRYRRDPRTGELGYYLMPPSTPTSPYLTTPPMPGFYGYFSQPPFFPKTYPKPKTYLKPETQPKPNPYPKPKPNPLPKKTKSSK